MPFPPKINIAAEILADLTAFRQVDHAPSLATFFLAKELPIPMRTAPLTTCLFILATLGPGCSNDKTPNLIHQEDSESRYIYIGAGAGGYQESRLEETKTKGGTRFIRHLNGDLVYIFTRIYGVDRPRISVESSNQANYRVSYDPDDEDAMQIIAAKLGLKLATLDRTIHALTLSRSAKELNITKAEKPAKPQWDVAKTNAGWPLSGVTMDELCLFLESRFYRPVVNKTNLEGHYSLILSSSAAKGFPPEGATKDLDHTGLQVQWEMTNAQVLVISD